MSDDLLFKELTEGEKSMYDPPFHKNIALNTFLLEFVSLTIKDEPQWINWVKKTNRREAVQPRLLVVGFYRIYSIKRNKMGKKQVIMVICCCLFGLFVCFVVICRLLVACCCSFVIACCCCC